MDNVTYTRQTRKAHGFTQGQRIAVRPGSRADAPSGDARVGIITWNAMGIQVEFEDGGISFSCGVAGKFWAAPVEETPAAVEDAAPAPELGRLVRLEGELGLWMAEAYEGDMVTFLAHVDDPQADELPIRRTYPASKITGWGEMLQERQGRLMAEALTSDIREGDMVRNAGNRLGRVVEEWHLGDDSKATRVRVEWEPVAGATNEARAALEALSVIWHPTTKLIREPHPARENDTWTGQRAAEAFPVHSLVKTERGTVYGRVVDGPRVLIGQPVKIPVRWENGYKISLMSPDALTVVSELSELGAEVNVAECVNCGQRIAQRTHRPGCSWNHITGPHADRVGCTGDGEPRATPGEVVVMRDGADLATFTALVEDGLGPVTGLPTLPAAPAAGWVGGAELDQLLDDVLGTPAPVVRVVTLVNDGRGRVQAHAPGCAHLNRTPAGAAQWNSRPVDSRRAVVLEVFGGFEGLDADGSNWTDFLDAQDPKMFAPCLDDLPGEPPAAPTTPALPCQTADPAEARAALVSGLSAEDWRTVAEAVNVRLETLTRMAPNHSTMGNLVGLVAKLGEISGAFGVLVTPAAGPAVMPDVCLASGQPLTRWYTEKEAREIDRGGDLADYPCKACALVLTSSVWEDGARLIPEHAPAVFPVEPLDIGTTVLVAGCHRVVRSMVRLVSNTGPALSYSLSYRLDQSSILMTNVELEARGAQINPNPALDWMYAIQ